MSHDEKLKIASAMIAFGGGFVGRLGELWLLADTDNCARIEAAWPEYIEQYRGIGAQEMEYRALEVRES